MTPDLTRKVIAEVIVETGGLGLQRPLDYNVPLSLTGKTFIGSRVLVPLGKRRVYGFVVGLKEYREKDDMRLRDVISLFDERPVFNEEQLRIARWMSAYYLTTPQRALKCIALPAIHKTKPPVIKYYYLNFDVKEIDRVAGELGRAAKQIAVLKAAAGNPGLTKKKLSFLAGASNQIIDTLVKKDLLYIIERVIERDPASGYSEISKRLELTGEQRIAVDSIAGVLHQQGHQVFLLHGVTGSGKTEVYLQIVECALRLGRQAIVLIPEISLTPQMIKEFKERFGDLVAVLHSRISRGERYDEWERITRGEASIVLGARSAIFAPLSDPGVIIIDEEHEFTYKQEESPRYHARAVALFRGHINKSVVVFGSATPSLDSYCRAVHNQPYRLLNIKKRVRDRPMPEIEIVDMRKEFRTGNKGIFSPRLYQAVMVCLEKKEQVILFLNRRGFNTFVVCRECGLVVKCPNCDISLTYHVQGRLRCHYCGYSQMAPGLCPECHSRHISYLGIGTQKVEQEAASLFPAARILRMDADTTGRKGSHGRILDSFARGDAGILIGTQMVAKGLNFPRVTLVGIVSADIGLYMPDFRASERTFQLITQVSGRSGRAENPGRVIIQTYNPGHYAVQMAAAGDYNGFFQTEMKIRKNLGYPPYSRMARLLFSGRKEDNVMSMAETACRSLDDFSATDKQQLRVVGPAPAPLARVRGQHRMHMVLWCREDGLLKAAVKHISTAVMALQQSKKVRFIVDIDPYSMM